ncbi:PHA/PHB synthase family protein [Pelagimonas varians]|uniref:Poly-beta-hydroxybutyrate polymerase n=1 Tax=Pelagimonas varians TaxID=696760 RepID=A0A238L3H7_9RHOB|nr:class I poly(R)-hydroxyalkanoic acid synthase [Pelagimonas varians]PYG26478.1 polyhydroxyalkanoate synthase [Pelagimonas varians]SMX49633.1 Poly-beta-hydroxybutyrate polymerase [Pelagimonas varians]
MTTNELDAGQSRARMEANLARIEELQQRLVSALTKKQKTPASLSGPEATLYAKAGQAYWQEALQNPAKLIEQQVHYWGQTMQHFAEAQKAFSGGRMEAPDNIVPDDRRFANPLWNSNPYFNFIKQQYQINGEAIRKAVENIEDLDPTEKRRLRFFAQQITDMLAPTNFFATNPDALEKAIKTDGESLVKGLENLVADVEANNGEMIVRLVDESAFNVGGNIATAKGEVVYRNRMMELIQYSPTTEKVQELPIVLFPPWINKFYILDLKEKNSLIRWIVDQGYTLFVVSWINPDEAYSDVGLEDYIEEGYMTAMNVAREICGTEQVNAVGYCIAGTTLGLTLALLKKRKKKLVKSATFFTTLTDFSDQGEFTPFLQNDFIDGIEEEIDNKGMLSSFIMARTFSYLRSNDLIYGPAIKSYMMGETPPAFDLLYWNGDGANLPGKMTMQYLRGLCQRNEFSEGTFELFGETLALKDVDVPLMSIATETDHIAAARDVYRGVQQMGSRSKTFVLGESGHIAGIVNPPSKVKYGHFLNADLSGDFDSWKDTATRHDGSWWPQWEAWLNKRSGKKTEARIPGDSAYPSLGPAPGTYVQIKAVKQKQ